MLRLTCSKCKKEKDATEFFRNRSKPTGYHCQCKECHHSPNRYPAKIWANYRLRMEDIDAMLAAQNDSCALCCDPIDITTWKIDHDHACDHEGKGAYSCKACVRGLLCHSCNIFAGYLEARVHILGKSLRYLGLEDDLAPGTVLRVPSI